MKKHLYNLATDKYRGPVAAVAKFFLFLLSLIYGLAVKILSSWQLTGALRLNCKVISVGNITLGGTGKTTIVEYIAKFLKENSRKVAILSRGYGKVGSRVKGQGASYEGMGDEPYMLAAKLKDIPVIVDPNRIRAAKRAIRDYGADTVILDDGLEQWKIKKDLEIIAIDAKSGFGNRRLIPRGILREPLSALKRADVFLLTKADAKPEIEKTRDFLRQLNRQAEIFTSIHQATGFHTLAKPEEPFHADSLRGKTVTLVSGIGDPGSFENLIRNLGVHIGLNFRFSDHYHYRQKDWEKIIRDSKNRNVETIITTEKDAARISHLRLGIYDLRPLVLRIELKLNEDEEGFRRRLLQLYRI